MRQSRAKTVVQSCSHARNHESLKRLTRPSPQHPLWAERPYRCAFLRLRLYPAVPGPSASHPCMNDPAILRSMLRGPGDRPVSIAVIGLSADPARPSHSVSAYMQRSGYKILPVNPGLKEVLGEPCFPSLQDLPSKPDLVNVFRLPRYLPAIVVEMIALGLRDVWVQLGIVNLEAAHRAEAAGLRVVMDRCLLIEHRRLRAEGHL